MSELPPDFPQLVRTPLLYHGTRNLDGIASSGTIDLPETGDLHVSLTSDFRVALYWAMLPRDCPKRESPGVIVFHRKSLLDAGYSLFAFDGTGNDDEAEWACDKPIHLRPGLCEVLRLET